MKKTAFNMKYIEDEIRKYTNVFSHLDNAMNELEEDCIVSDEWNDLYPIREEVVERLNDLNAFCKIVNIRYPEFFTEVEVEDINFDDEEGIDWADLLNDFEEEEEA